jgi:hypothetical protein
MAEDSHLFSEKPRDGWYALYEAKLIHLYDHRWATYSDAEAVQDVDQERKTDPGFKVTPRYWIDEIELGSRLQAQDWNRAWLLGWRDITNATNERTVIAAILPRIGVGNKIPLVFIFPEKLETASCFIGCLSSLALDFVARQKIGGTSMSLFTLKQLPCPPPSAYGSASIDFIHPHVLELTYTSHDLKPWAQDLGYDGPPFCFDPERRALLRAELDAYYAHLYGLTRDELRYILDPSDLMGPDYPSETFRVLKNNELRQFGEYRTQRLVLEAWDRLFGGH